MTKPKNPPAAAPILDVGARPAVEERGEIKVVLDGVEMSLRPSFEAIAAFEGSTGKGLLQLTRDALDGSMPLSVAAQIVTECVRAWGRSTGDRAVQASGAPRIAELMLESPGGFRTALNTLAGVLALATTGGYTASGEMKPATVTTTA